MKNLRISVLILVSILSLTACSTASKQTTSLTATQTPAVIATISPSATVIPTPTLAPTMSPTTSPTATPSSTVKSTTSPTPLVTPKPTQKPTTETAPKEENTTVKIVSVSSPAARNSTATLKAKVAPNATASIVVHYKSGPSKAAGLESKKADANGNVSWSWHVGGNTTLGNWRITVSSGNSNAETEFEVVH